MIIPAMASITEKEGQPVLTVLKETGNQETGDGSLSLLLDSFPGICYDTLHYKEGDIKR